MAISRGLAIRVRLNILYLVEAMAAFGSTLLTVGVYFYTEHEFHWTLKQNFMLAAGQGVVYTIGALLANRFAQRWGRRAYVVAAYVMLGLLLAPAAVWTKPAIVAAALVAYMLVISTSWPVMESLVASGAGAHEMNRRLGKYNLLWSGTGAVAGAINGTIIKYWPAGVLLIPMSVHLACAMILWLMRVAGEDAAEAEQAHAAGEPEEALLSQRRLALWLSRVALPSTYVVVYAIGAMLPSLAAMKELGISQRTLVGSVWLAARCAAFVALGATVWWHTRPRMLLWAAFLMAGGFVGTTLSASYRGEGLVVALTAAGLFQVLLGLALGMIYAGSLYFGMVLSEGSTEHGGYHEALIGLGQLMGAVAGMSALWLRPGSTAAAITAVSGVIGLTLVAATGVAIKEKGKRQKEVVALAGQYA